MPSSVHNSNKAVLKAIRAIVGPVGMRDLCAERGGTEICIPRDCDADHWMSRILGEDVANRVCEHFTVLNADGRVVGDVRCYLPIQNSRVLALQQQIEEEVKQALIAGKSVHDICRDIGVTARKVRDHVKYLRQCGVLPTPEAPYIKSGSKPDRQKYIERRRVAAERVAKADEMLIAGRTTRAVVLATCMSAQLVRKRRKHLLDVGRLYFGERHATPVPDHSANVGEMVSARPHEVQP